MTDKNTLDIKLEEKEIKDWKAARRLELRNEYIRELYDPFRNTSMMDEQLLRFSSTRHYFERLYTPTMRLLVPIFLIWGGIFYTGRVFQKRREKREHLYRTGQVKYKDRLFKFTA